MKLQRYLMKIDLKTLWYQIPFEMKTSYPLLATLAMDLVKRPEKAVGLHEIEASTELKSVELMSETIKVLESEKKESDLSGNGTKLYRKGSFLLRKSFTPSPFLSIIGYHPSVIHPFMELPKNSEANGCTLLNFIDSKDFRELTTQKDYSPIKTLISLLLALEHMAHLGLFHDDIQASNLLLTPDGYCSLIDWDFISSTPTKSYLSEYLIINTFISEIKSPTNTLEPIDHSCFKSLDTSQLRDTYLKKIRELICSDALYSELMKILDQAILPKEQNLRIHALLAGKPMPLPSIAPSEQIKESLFTPLSDLSILDMHSQEALERFLDAISIGDLKTVEDFIQRGMDINKTFDLGETPLMLAVGYGHIEIIELLLEQKADITLERKSCPYKLDSIVFSTGNKQIIHLFEKYHPDFFKRIKKYHPDFFKLALLKT